MPKAANGDTCTGAIRAVMEPGKTVTFADLVKRIKRKGKWKNSTIWQYLMSLVVNLPPARHHWPNIKPFLFLHPDGRYELSNETGGKSSRDSGTTSDGGLSPGELIDLHLKLETILDKLDRKKVPNEGFSARVMRLREAKVLPRNIVCMMLTVNSLRNMVVHEQFIMGPNEAKVVEGAMAAIEAWSKRKA